jgi:hypothetical protein
LVLKETYIKAKLCSHLRRKLPHTVVHSFNAFGAMVQGGIPDLCVVWQRRTTWIEVKLIENKPEDSPLQLEIMKRTGRACYVIWDRDARMGDVFWVGNMRTPKCELNFDGLVEILIGSYIEEED